ncbi:MAG: hypothetical protein V4481_00640 [Patescibacteria group bacterium]
MTNYIVIGKFRNKENTQKLVNAIRAKGKTCYDFAAKPADPENPHISAEEQMKNLESHPDFLHDPVHRDHFVRDLEGLQGAETVVLLLPAGTSAHIESGIAFGMGKKLILIGTPEKPETLYYIFSEHYKDGEEFLKTIK